jgi:hypothetical protein
MASESLVRPTQQEDISIVWLQSKLGPTVQSFELTRKVTDQTAGKAYITVTHEDGTEQHLCLKGFVNSATPKHHAMVMALYNAEVAFYELLAPPLRRLGLVIPKNLGAEDGLVIMEDIAKQGCQFGTAGETLGVETVKGYAEQLAVLHGGRDKPTSYISPSFLLLFVSSNTLDNLGAEYEYLRIYARCNTVTNLSNSLCLNCQGRIRK